MSEVLSPLAGDNDRVWSLRFYRNLMIGSWWLPIPFFTSFKLEFLGVEVVTIFLGVLMEVGSLMFSLFIIRFEM